MYIAEAIEAVRQGHKITRETWKKGTFIYLVPSRVDGSSRWINPHFDMINEFGQIVVGYKADAGDLFASDWQIAEA